MTDPPRFSRNPIGRVALFANKAKIDEMLKGGLMLLEVYEQLQLPGSYKQFCRFCERELGRVPLRRGAGARGAPAPTAAEPAPARPAEKAVQAPADDRPTQAKRPAKLWTPPKPKAPIIEWDPTDTDLDKITGAKSNG